MYRKGKIKVIALGLVTSMLFSYLPAAELNTVSAAENSIATFSTTGGDYMEMLYNNYTKVSAKYTAKDYEGADVVCTASGTVSDLGQAELTSETKGYPNVANVIDMGVDDVVILTVEVPKTALYFIEFDYLSYDKSIMPIEMSMMVDGVFPFFESRNLEFESTWVSKDTRTFDRYDNEIVTVPEKLIQWESKYLMDGSHRHSIPLKVELEQGTHEITLTIGEGNFLFGGLTLRAPFEVAEYTGSEKAEGDGFIEIQAEDFTYRNDSSIHAVAEFDTSLTPYEVKDTVLNTIDSDSFYEAGQRVTYEFDVEKAGYYYIAMNYRQSEKTDFPVFVDVRLDNEIPNKAFQSYALSYNKKYETISLVDDENNKLSVYLEEGTHSISFTISNDPICHLLEGLDEVMSGVNDLALEITKVAGTNADKYRDLKLSRYIPNLENNMYGYVNRMYELQDSIRPYANKTGTVAIVSNMIIAAEQIKSMAEEPDEIPYRVAELSTSRNSATRNLASSIDKLIENNLAFDKIYIYQEQATIPSKPGIFQSAWMNIKRFFTSFTEQAYSTSNTNSEHLQVWVNRSSQSVQVMQKLIDESFTPQTGIEVDISIMPDQYKLVLANTSGKAPDVATGINYTIPYELAIRGALVDMMEFEDFQETAAPYEAGFFMSSTVNGGIYAMPETMNFYVLFYRSDILDKLGLEVPNTMQDVIDMLPELQMRGLNFSIPVSGMLLMRNFHGTTPSIYQFGGSLYGETAQQGTMLGSAESVEGFTFLTDLFTVYDIPINIDNFYQHLRNGDIPIGIADYTTYNLMTNAAPELKNSWEIALVPGVEKEDGTVDRTTCGCAESTVIFKSTEDREQMAWEFTKWWSSTETQAQYGQTMQMTYGKEYMWATANMDAFMQLPWDSSDKRIIAEQMSYVIDVVRVPGTYLLEREISNAFNDIVVNNKTAQMRIDKAVKTINREFQRKLEEFEYIDSEGKTLEEYVIPNIDSVRKMLGREE